MVLFSVISRREIESAFHYQSIAGDKSHLVISISSDEGAACVPSLYSCKGVLRLVFEDIDEHFGEKDNLFTRKQAREILDFVDEHIEKDSIELIVVHCHAGISRSAGTAAALAYILNKDDYDIVKAKPCFNRFVYRTILNEYFGVE